MILLLLTPHYLHLFSYNTYPAIHAVDVSALNPLAMAEPALVALVAHTVV